MSRSILKEIHIRAETEENWTALGGVDVPELTPLPTSQPFRRESTEGDGNLGFNPISRFISIIRPFLPSPTTSQAPAPTMVSSQYSQETYTSATQTLQDPRSNTETGGWTQTGTWTDTWAPTGPNTWWTASTWTSAATTSGTLPQETATQSVHDSTGTDGNPNHTRTLSIPTYDFPPSTMTGPSTASSTTSPSSTSGASSTISSSITSTLESAAPTTTAQDNSQTSTLGLPTDVAGLQKDSGKGSTTPAGLVVGSIVGGVVGAALIVGIIFWFCRHRAKKHKNDIRTPEIDTRGAGPNEKSWNVGHSAYVTANRSARLSEAAEHQVNKLERKWRASALGGKLGVEPSPTSSKFMQHIQYHNRSNPSVAAIAPSMSSIREGRSANESTDEREVYHTTSWILGKRDSNKSPEESLNSVGLGLHKSKDSVSSLSASDSGQQNAGRSLTTPPRHPSPPATTLAPPTAEPSRIAQDRSTAGVSGPGGLLSPKDRGRDSGRGTEGRSNRFNLEMARRAEESRKKRMTDELVSRPSTLSSNHSSLRSPMTVSSMGDWNDVSAAISYSNRHSNGRR